jgi:hypothetical protein
MFYGLLRCIRFHDKNPEIGAEAQLASPIQIFFPAFFINKARVSITCGFVVSDGDGYTKFGLRRMRSFPLVMCSRPPIKSSALVTAYSMPFASLHFH